MKYHLPRPTELSLILLLFSLVGAIDCFAVGNTATHKMSIFFSSNVQAELEPCG